MPETTTAGAGLDAAVRSRILGLTIRGASLANVLRLLADETPLSPPLESAVAAEYERVATVLIDRDAYRTTTAEKAVWMMGVYRALAEQSGPYEIDTIDELEPETFFRDYYFRNRPVKIAGFAKRWQSFAEWQVPSLLDRFGSQTVEVSTNRDAHETYDVDFEPTRREMIFSEFVAMLRAAADRETNDFYLVARNLNVRRAFKPLVENLKPLPGVLSEHRADYLNFWIGPRGTMTRLHHDLTNVLFCQLAGSKRMWFVPPHDTALVYNRLGVVAEADAARPNYKKHPLFRAARVRDVTLDEGDAVLIPVGWWHQVQSLTESVSLTFINFAVPNLFAMTDQPHWRFRTD
ncbi:MAG TPA: cupin-like domain-containing protein [Candidatus Elarobacter sp.]|nr:cupin-like domain-containing protein [Candidatus Elarobacter sp.]